MFCKIFSLTILKAKIDEIWCLKGKMEINNERMIDLFENVDLGNNKFRLFAQDNFFLLKHFQGIKLLVSQALSQKDLTKRPLSKMFNNIEINIFQ